MESELKSEINIKDVMQHQSELFLVDSFLEETLNKTSFQDFLFHLTIHPDLYDKVRGEKDNFWREKYHRLSPSSSLSFDFGGNWFDAVMDLLLEEKKFFNTKFFNDISSLRVDCRDAPSKADYIREIYIVPNNGIRLNNKIIGEIQWWKNGDFITVGNTPGTNHIHCLEREVVSPALSVQMKDNSFFVLSSDNRMYRIYMNHNELKITHLTPNLFKDITITKTLYVERYFNNSVRLIFIIDSAGQLYIAYLNDLNVMLERRKQTKINGQLQGISHLEYFEDDSGMVRGVKLFTLSGDLYFLYLSNPLVRKRNVINMSEASAVMQILEDIDNSPLTRIPFKQLCYVPYSNRALLLDNDGKIFITQQFLQLQKMYQQKEPFELKEGSIVKNFIVKDGDSIQWEFESYRYVPYLHYFRALEKKEVEQEWMDRQFRYYQKKGSRTIYAAPLPSSS